LFQVSEFYEYWLGFVSKEDFSWADEYNPGSAPNRKVMRRFEFGSHTRDVLNYLLQVRRLMEDENKKLRKRAKAEFNESVRELAAFVRKRDKRVLEYQVRVSTPAQLPF
jgi:DnaJ family protein A protein 5